MKKKLWNFPIELKVSHWAIPSPIADTPEQIATHIREELRKDYLKGLKIK